MDQRQKIGFIGTGVMGKSMALNLMNAGYALTIYTRTKEKAQDLLDKGAGWADSPASLADTCNVIITIVGYPRDVEEIYFGDRGLFSGISAETILIDMTTSSPMLASKIYEQAVGTGCQALDAPVSGGDTGAKNGSLSIMVGGEEDTFQAVLPVFNILGETIVYQGPAGSGQHCKMCNQIAIASTMIGVCEALAYAKHAGLNPETVLQSIESGAAGSWSLSNLGPRILEQNFEPGFFVKHFIKDMGIASAEAKTMNVDTPGLDLALALYRELAESGFEDDGTQALFRLFSSKNM